MSVVDWQAAGRKADAKRVIRLYRRSFDNPAKRLARTRAIDALRAAGIQTVITLWGGGICAEELVAAGFRVIAVDNGSMTVMDGGRPVSTTRKRRAMEAAARDGGYECRWGDAERFLDEADGAYLDFHGPWSRSARETVAAARHMTAVVVTLIPSHDMTTGATSPQERQMAYQLFLKMAWADQPRWASITANGHVRRLTDYHADQGRMVFVYLLARKHVRIPGTLRADQRAKMRTDVQRRIRTAQMDYYNRHRDRILSTQRQKRQTETLEIACRHCATLFIPDRRQARYCGDRCRHAVRILNQRRRRALAVQGTASEAQDQAA